MNYQKFKDNTVKRKPNQMQQQDRFKFLMERADTQWKRQISTMQDKLDNINRL